MRYAVAVVIGLVLHLLAYRVALAPGVAVPVAVPMLIAAIAGAVALLALVIRASRRFRSSPTWRPARPTSQPVPVPSWAV